jgi:hypothetical protein
MTEKEQIKEMRKEIENGFRKADCRQPYTNEPYPYFETQKTAIAEALYNAGYRKVLFNTENGKAVDVCQYAPWKLVEGYTEREIGKARKETAKEILQEWADDNSSMGLDNTFVKNIAKKYGVEVEE